MSAARFGKSDEELSKISEQLRRGPYLFDPADVQRHLAAYQQFKETTPRTLILEFVKWSGPAILLLAAMLALVFLNN